MKNLTAIQGLLEIKLALWELAYHGGIACGARFLRVYTSGLHELGFGTNRGRDAPLPTTAPSPVALTNHAQAGFIW
jgi:hypothetical protein